MKSARAALKRLLFERQQGRCCYCGRKIELHPPAWGAGKTPDNFATLEHLLRKADGGQASNDNMALACFWCNTHRGGINWCEFKTMQMGA